MDWDPSTLERGFDQGSHSPFPENAEAESQAQVLPPWTWKGCDRCGNGNADSGSGWLRTGLLFPTTGHIGSQQSPPPGQGACEAPVASDGRMVWPAEGDARRGWRAPTRHGLIIDAIVYGVALPAACARHQRRGGYRGRQVRVSSICEPIHQRKRESARTAPHPPRPGCG